MKICDFKFCDFSFAFAYIYIYIYNIYISIYKQNHQRKNKSLINQVSEVLLVRRLNGIQKPPVGKFHLALLPNHPHMLRVYLSKVSCSRWYV